MKGGSFAVWLLCARKEMTSDVLLPVLNVIVSLAQVGEPPLSGMAIGVVSVDV
jgi:hypothetical protein